MSKDNMTELAKLFKARDNNVPPSITTGIILSPLPEIQIRLTEQIILDKTHLIIAEHIYKHYEDELIEGNEVILMPTNNEQTYFVLDRAVRL